MVLGVGTGIVFRGQQGGFANQQSPAGPMLNTLGEQIIMDWLQKAALDGMVYQVRAGTITAPLTGDVLITDTAAEMAADCAAGTTIIPVRFNAILEGLGGTLPEMTCKSVATVSSSGSAFTPLPLRTDGPAAVSTARVAAAGAVTVTAELATTTMRHFQAFSDSITAQPWVGHTFVPAPVLVGARSFYVQVGSVGTGSTYFADFDYVEISSSLVER